MEWSLDDTMELLLLILLGVIMAMYLYKKMSV